MDNCRGEKKPLLSTNQQSFRIDNLLTRKVIEQQQQPDHYSMYSPSKVDKDDLLNLTISPPHDDMVSDPIGFLF